MTLREDAAVVPYERTRSTRWRFLSAYPAATAGAVLFLLILLLAVTAPWLSPYNPRQYAGAPLAPPSFTHPLGTNDVGQDLWSELLYGTRTSLVIGLSVALIGTLLSLLVGLTAILKGGWFDFSLMRLVDGWLMIPPLLLVLLITAFLQPRLLTLILVLSLFSWADGARIMRSQGLEVKQELYVQAAQALGASPLHIAWRHIVPALYPLVTLSFLVQIRRAILLESSLAFLGLADPNYKSWGVMIQYGMKFVALGDYWLCWLLPPALALGLTLISLALVGFGLESRFEPTLRHRRHCLRPRGQYRSDHSQRHEKTEYRRDAAESRNRAGERTQG